MSKRPVVFFDVAIDKKPVGRIRMNLYNDIVPKTAKNFKCLYTKKKDFKYQGCGFQNLFLLCKNI